MQQPLANLIILALILFISTISKAQGDSIIIDEFEKATHLEFNKAVTNSTFSNFGNYASLSTANNSLGASINILDGKRAWGISVSGGATEGVTELFNSGNPNSTFKGSLQFHLLTRIDTAYRSDDKIRVINDAIRLNQMTYDKALLDLHIRKDSIESIAALNKINNKIAKINRTTPSSAFTTDSLTYELAKSQYEQTQLLEKISKIQSDFYRDSIEWNIQLAYDAEYESLIKKKNEVGLSSYKIGWWTFQIASEQTEFKNLALQENPVTSNLSDASYLSRELGISYSTFSKSELNEKNHFCSVGASIGQFSNFNDLSRVTLESRIPLSGDSTQVQVSSTTAYRGNFRTSLTRVRLFFDYYKFYGIGKQEIALHLNPTLTFQHDDAIISSIMIGALIPFKSSDSDDSKVNLEIFYKVNDIFNSIETSNAFNNRSVIGMTATVPFDLFN